MKYMVMECHPGYAVVMDNAGRFLKVANMHYEIGQTVSSVLEMNMSGSSSDTKSHTLAKNMDISCFSRCLPLPYCAWRMAFSDDALWFGAYANQSQCTNDCQLF